MQKDKLVKAYASLRQKNIIPKNEQIENILKLKSTRSQSGIVVVSVLTKPYPCPNNCLYCPTQKNAPKSYLKNEPAVMRAQTCEYSPYRQTTSRLSALKAVGHLTDKVNIRIIGGTWSYYSKHYQTKFIKEIFRAANDFNNEPSTSKQNLVELQNANETAKSRIVEISIETRPDYIALEEILRLRKLGVTKVELGVQSIYNDVLDKNNRGHHIEQTISATKMLKDAGFKVSYQMMLNLPGSTFQKDLKMFERLFSDPVYCPDHIKIYPLALVREADIYDLYIRGEYKPYTQDELVDLLSKVKAFIPPYCRVERVIRDIPADYIVEGGAAISNLRQVVLSKMEKSGKTCQCIRCREIKDEKNFGSTSLVKRIYKSADGIEHFLSVETKNGKLISMLRLRLTKNNQSLKMLKNCALIREIHTYGPQTAIGKQNHSTQHQGYGKQLMERAEMISRENGYKRIAVIAGIGAREYFRKLGYKHKQTYMLKYL